MYSILLNTIKSFPTGRTTEELLTLINAEFDHEKRLNALSELSQLNYEGLVYRARNGKWKPTILAKKQLAPTIPIGTPNNGIGNTVLRASPAKFLSIDVEGVNNDKTDEIALTPQALIRYWRSALRSDPRGGITQYDERHGVDWQLVSGNGPLLVEQNKYQVVQIELDNLHGEFRQALLTRQANENTLAIGWPISMGERQGAPAIWPIGLINATWKRSETHLEIVIENDDVLINPDWIKYQSRNTGWQANALQEIFTSADGLGVPIKEFLLNLRESVAGHTHGKLSEFNFIRELELDSTGVFNAMALFLPSDSTFTAGAVKDLDTIGQWSTEKISRTALAPLLGIVPDSQEDPIHAANPVDLNFEQLEAVRNSLSSSLSVVTGPPGTGKSQAIVSMVASILSSNGSVLVASKNHQALDAVEDRLSGLAPDTKFHLRTLDPENQIDNSFFDASKEIIVSPASNNEGLSDLPIGLKKKIELREKLLKEQFKFTELKCEIAEICDRLEKRKGNTPPEEQVKESFIKRFINWIKSLARFNEVGKINHIDLGAPTQELEKLVQLKNVQISMLNTDIDVVDLSEKIKNEFVEVFPKLIIGNTSISNDIHNLISHKLSDWEFAGRNTKAPGDLVREVLKLRPLWLSSVLGTPKRIPLQAGMFDLVIFDEASQCDIASALPLFARAKRAVVVGDNKQLSYIPQVGLQQDKNLMLSQKLPLGEMSRFSQSKQSLFDFSSRISVADRVLLRQQYRSNPEIVRYISEQFYGGQLVAAVDPKKLTNVGTLKPGIHWDHVKGPSITENGNVNTRESKAITLHLTKLLIDQSYRGTVGVIAPFRPQVARLEEEIRSVIPENICDEVRLRVATVDKFQGQERDLILFSPTVNSTSASSAISFFQKDFRRLNVAISRAISVVHIFGDLDYAKKSPIKSLLKLAYYASGDKGRDIGRNVFDSSWERTVYHALKNEGLEAFPQYEIAGRRLDFALFGENGVKLDVEVDGRRWHQDQDGKRKTSDHWRDHQLKSLGWKVRRFWVDELSSDIGVCIDTIKRDLQESKG